MTAVAPAPSVPPVRLLAALLLLATPAGADPAADVAAAAHSFLPALPPLIAPYSIEGRCGIPSPPGLGVAEEGAIYCTSERRILMTLAARVAPDAAYRAAHLYGHALTVETGVADAALAAIRARPAEEPALRADVTRMVECLAGVVAAAAGYPDGPPEGAERFTGAHWGHRPAAGPRVSIGAAERHAWFARGAEAGTFAACDTPSFPADLVVRATLP